MQEDTQTMQRLHTEPSLMPLWFESSRKIYSFTGEDGISSHSPPSLVQAAHYSVLFSIPIFFHSNHGPSFFNTHTPNSWITHGINRDLSLCLVVTPDLHKYPWFSLLVHICPMRVQLSSLYYITKWNASIRSSASIYIPQPTLSNGLVAHPFYAIRDGLNKSFEGRLMASCVLFSLVIIRNRLYSH